MAEPGDDIERLDPDDIDVERIVDEERAASRRLSSIKAGRRMGGAAGAGLAGAMLAISDIYEGSVKQDDSVAVAEHPGEPGDIDVDGIDVTVGDVDVWAPPPAPPEPDSD
ncbi:MAG: hypothetical protein QNM02_15125 [Acidimicrobiia bacterium]|nr:hypothetical protein [Acidimicrobiia bacterium]